MHLDQRTVGGEVETPVELPKKRRNPSKDAARNYQELNRLAEGRSAAANDCGEQYRENAGAAGRVSRARARSS